MLLPFEYNFIPAFLSLILVTLNVVTFRANLFVISLLVLFIILLPLSLVNFNFDDFVKDIAFISFFLCGALFSHRRFYYLCLNAHFLTIVLSVNIFVCLFQLIGLKFLFDEILIRQFARGFGVSGIYGEPSFLAFALISLSTVYLVKPVEAASHIKTRIILLLTMMSGSTVGLFQLIVLFLASKQKILIALVTLLAATAVIMYFPRMIRITQVVVDLYNQGFVYILIDGSLGARYAYIQRDIVYFIENFGYVRGFGTYGSAIDNFSVSFFDEKFPYDTSLSGSLMGRFIVELNFLIVLMLGLVTLRACLYRRSILYIFFILLFLSFQMISTFFGPFIFALGFVCNEIFRKG